MVTVPCATSDDMASAGSHRIQVAPDWSVTTPHDLDAERVAAGLGGFLSCLHLVDVVVPLVCGLLQMHARRAVPAITRGTHGSWRPASGQAASCCGSYSSAQAAAEHLRSISHACTRSGANELLTRTLVDGALGAHQGSASLHPQASTLARVAECVLGESGPRAVWEAGLHPSLVAAIHDEVVGHDGPALPEALYLGVVSRRPDLAWLADTVAATAAALDEAPDRSDTPELAEWLAWTQTPLDRRERRARAGWLAIGVPRSWIADLSRAGYTPRDAETLATASGLSQTGVADMLMGWLGAGCQPSPDDLIDLFASGVPPWYRPSRGAVARLRSSLGETTGRATTTELGLMLALEGTVPSAERALRAPAGGPRAPQDAHLRHTGQKESA